MIAWHVLHDDAEYKDLGPDWFRREDAEAKKRRLIRQLEAMGLAVKVERAAA